jgi:selenide,water dikinase
MSPAELDKLLSSVTANMDPSLLVGIRTHDDAAVYRLPSGEAIIQTVDFFTPVVDDPYTWGAIAAANSISDVYAMNGRPLFALNIACFPKKLPMELWCEVLRGGADKAREAGIVIAGGHTIDDAEPKYGLVVTGLIDPRTMWTHEGAKPGDALVLTKPLGSGIISTALRAGKITMETAQPMIRVMLELNRGAAEILSHFDVHACTDITGFGLLGHATEISRSSKVKLEFAFSQVPILDLAVALAETGPFPGGTWSNREYLQDIVSYPANFTEKNILLLCDAQTSGGLLATLPDNQAQDAISELKNAGMRMSAIIGRALKGEGMEIIP